MAKRYEVVLIVESKQAGWLFDPELFEAGWTKVEEAIRASSADAKIEFVSAAEETR